MTRNLITIQQRSENGYVFQSPGLKTGVENGIFWSEIGSGFGEPGGTPLPRIPRSTPPRAIELLKTSSDPQITNGVEGSEVKQETVPMKGQRTLTNINLLLFVKTAWNFQL